MTIEPDALALYIGALVILFATPGPVWVALTARALTGGFSAAWPLAVGVTLGDLLWPLVAVFGLSWIVGQFDHFMTVMRYVASAIFAVMGFLLIRNAGRPIPTDSKLTRPGRWAGFAAGVAVILGNPKAILFYMGVLPGFFDLRHVNGIDIGIIAGASMAIPLAGNLLLAALIGRARRLLTSPAVLYRINIAAGVLLILVGLIIASI